MRLALHRLGMVRLTPVQTNLAAGALVLAIGCAWLVLTRSDSLPPGSAGPPLPLLQTVAEPARPLSPYQYDAIVSRNAFARSRQPPAEPWAPVETGIGGDPAAGSSADETGGLPLPGLRLYGTVQARVGQGSFAIIEADPNRPGPELYHLGDDVASYRLQAIYRGRVVLTGPGGELTLTLAPDTAPRGTP